DPIADMLTRIRNAVLVNKKNVVIPFSKIKFEMSKILEKEGFISGFEKIDNTENNNSTLKLNLKYKSGEPVIRGLKKISTPGRRVYQGYKEIPKILPSLGVLIVSTPRGLLTNQEAKKQKAGGELICEIY
ncbi:30S ribosomal protein S8, partial [Patescibacteria group bacterium]|nr:30S ribosomal protein S8 [Patescibacteria group bacterium]